jgi:16S rRNA processing protein RimM
MPNNKIVIAKIGKTIGLKGELKINLYCDIDFTQLQSFQPLFLSTPHHSTWIALAPETFTLAKGRISFQAYPNIVAASVLVHGLLGIEKEQLPPLLDDTFYLHDLLGKTVLNLDGVLFGFVTDVMHNGAHDVLVCRDDQHEYLIPFINDYVVMIGPDTITVLWNKDYSV